LFSGFSAVRKIVAGKGAPRKGQKRWFNARIAKSTFPRAKVCEKAPIIIAALDTRRAGTDLMASQPVVSAMHWRTLYSFAFYRLCLAVVLAILLYYQVPISSVSQSGLSGRFTIIIGFYLLVNAGSLAVVSLYRKHFNWQLSIQVLFDVLVLTLLTHAGNGLRSSLAILLLVTLAGAGLVGQGRQVLSYAAVAALAVLGEESMRLLRNRGDVVDFFEVGLLCAGFFGIAISARLLANRVVLNEELARKRGEALRNQTIVSQCVIKEMQDGVLVLNRNGNIKLHNPRVEQLLGLGDPGERMLSTYSTELAVNFRNWCSSGGSEPMLIRAPASGMQLRARFITTESSEGDVLVLLEDIGNLQEQARQMKLAALGRLTANIAHEIRNPLSAIRHASELMREESANPTHARLLRIVLDNAQRVERIVSDVLEVGRRDQVHHDIINLRQTLPLFAEEFAIKEKVSANIVKIEISGHASIVFDRSHFHQILWNLVGNALRYSRQEVGSVQLRVMQGGSKDRVDIHVIDDGEGVNEEYREQIFEPFFTTHSRGTGLGLHIARELCEANDARLELLDSPSGADFCISGRIAE
jgi:two-component system sensor histidine kinase PilS (NtrC family)